MPPAIERIVDFDGAGGCGAGTDLHHITTQVSATDLGGTSGIDAVAGAYLAMVVAPPTPQGIAGIDGADVGTPGTHRLHVAKASDLHRHITHRRGADTQLTIAIVTPAPHITCGGKGTTEIGAYRNVWCYNWDTPWRCCHPNLVINE